MAKIDMERLAKEMMACKEVNEVDILREEMLKTPIKKIIPEECESINLSIKIDDLVDYHSNRFSSLKVNEEKWSEFVGSIKEFGIINPLIVRKRDDSKYQILAGHNRKQGAIEAGLKEVPCRVMDIDDVDASVLVAVTNNQREGTTDLEWAYSYKDTYEALVRKQGGDRKSESFQKNENQECLNFNEKSSYHNGNLILEKVEVRDKTLDIVAKKYGIARTTLQRKIRLAYLEKQLAMMFVDKKITQDQAVHLSYLTRMEQNHVYSTMLELDTKITSDIARDLRVMSDNKDKADLSNDDVRNFIIAKLGGDEINHKKKKPVSYIVSDDLFPPEIKKSDREKYVNVILAYMLDHKDILDELFEKE